MVIGPYRMFDGAEIGETHSQDRCGWGYECQDCWGEQWHISGGTGHHLPGKDAAVAALDRHLRFYCKTNIHAMTPDELQRAMSDRSRWEYEVRAEQARLAAATSRN